MISSGTKASLSRSDDIASLGSNQVSSGAAAAPAYSDTKCINFVAASSQYVGVANDAVHNFTTAMSLSAWIKTSSSPDGGGILMKGDYNNARQYYMFQDFAPNSTKLGVVLAANGSGVIAKYYRSSVAINDGAWHHVAYTYNGTGSALKVYIDGAEDTLLTKVTDNACTSLNTTANPVSIGALYGNAARTNFWDGRLDEISLWNTTLSAADITAAYNSGHPPDLSAHSKVANLISWWKMGDGDTIGAGGIIDSVSAKNGTPTNTPTIVTDAP